MFMEPLGSVEPRLKITGLDNGSFIVICVIYFRVRGPTKYMGLGPLKALIRPCTHVINKKSYKTKNRAYKNTTYKELQCSPF